MDRANYHVDFPATRAYWEENDWQCSCSYCRNYRKTFPAYFPEAVKVLSDLGLQYDHALEIMDYYWNDTKDKRLYEAYYPVQGTLQEDHVVLYEKDAVITLYRPDSPSLSCPRPKTNGPYFMAVVSVQLPWELDEPPEV